VLKNKGPNSLLPFAAQAQNATVLIWLPVTEEARYRAGKQKKNPKLVLRGTCIV